MKKIVITTIAASFAALSFAGVKIGTIDTAYISQHSQVVKNMFDHVKAQLAPMHAKQAALMAKVSKENADLQKNKATMSKTQIAAAEKSIQAQSQELQQDQGKYMAAVMGARQDAMQSIVASIKAAATEVAKKDHLDLVMQQEAIVYAKNSKDITKEVIADMK